MTKEEIFKIKEHIEIHARREHRAIIITEILWKAVDELERIEELEKENEQLKARIERMKCCGNCFHNNKPSDKEFCWNCERQLDEQPIIKDEWEIAE